MRETDVLILGAGLAGLRAAWAAAKIRPGLRVAVAWQGRGPSGSSFANPNGRLGLHLPHLPPFEQPLERTFPVAEADACPSGVQDAPPLPQADAALKRWPVEAGTHERFQEQFVDAVLRLAPPGVADPALAAILARDAPGRLADLLALDLDFQRAPDGRPARFPSCFLPGQARAVILADLPQVFARFRDKAQSLGALFWPGLRALRLLADPPSGRILGALMQETGEAGRTGETVLVRADRVIAAMGGPARLFELCRSGAGNRGEAHALLALAGAEMRNEGYLQYMWSEIPSGRFWPMARLAEPGARLLGPDGLEERLPGELAALAPSRAAHCPISHSLKDAALDRFVLARLDEQGAVRIREAGGRIVRIAPLAQAGNGGARIDGCGQTSVKGLFAAGECASGMHGADRIGGAMVLSCLVFGARAGEGAALEARANDQPCARRFRELAALSANELQPDADETFEKPPISPDMQAALVLGQGPGLAQVAARLDEAAQKSGSLLPHAAWRIARHLLENSATTKHSPAPKESPCASS